MTGRLAVAIVGAGCFAGAFTLAPPTAHNLREPIHWLVRPAVLPFAWRDLQDAFRSGDPGEALARAQRILQLLPAWTDGQIVFSYRFATEGATASEAPADRAAAAWRRLQIALAWLESTRRTAGRREVELLQAMAMLPEIALAREPGLEPFLRRAGGASAMANRYLEEAERISDSPTIREQRTFLTPTLAAGHLATGDRIGAIAVLDNGIARSTDVADRELATEWAALLTLVVRHLRGEEIDLTAVRADSRMTPLLPYLH
ncbi:MAG: hypothetical protein KDC98_12010 [Planctomycetes bacterium]|nr:hypothetical protein [Planctomycetota bacterium]